MDTIHTNNIIEHTAEIVSAYVANNSLPVAELPAIIKSVHGALGQISSGKKETAPVEERKQPFVPIKKSITEDYLISLEDGQRFKSLKRHLMTTYGMTPQQYREEWGLPRDYPMVAPAYAKSRSALAKSLGLGRKSLVAVSDEPEPANDAGPKRRRRRASKAA